MEKIKWPENTSNEEKRIGEKRTLLNNILRRQANWIGHRNCLLHDAIEGQKMEVIGVGRRRRTQFLDDSRNRRAKGVEERKEITQVILHKHQT